MISRSRTRSPDRSVGIPDCRVPKKSPGPRSSRSRSAMTNPSVGPDQGPQARLARLAERLLVQQQAGRLVGAAADAAAQLMQLRQPEPFGVLDDHDGGVRHVDADLDHGGRDEDVHLPCGERPHDAVLLLRAQPAVQQREPVLREHLGGEVVGHLRRGPQVDLSTTPPPADTRCTPAARASSSSPHERVHLVAAGLRNRPSSRSACARAAGRESPTRPDRRRAVSASVRGIGVAVITSTSGFQPFARSTARCITPNRCCSSTTTRPSGANSTCLLHQRVRADHELRSRPDSRSAQHVAPASRRRRGPRQQRDARSGPAASSRRIVR